VRESLTHWIHPGECEIAVQPAVDSNAAIAMIRNPASPALGGLGNRGLAVTMT
jgi:hypothetical protein